MKRVRDRNIDLLRGIAAVIVVIGHVIQRFSNFEDNILFNIIFSLQMPLFMMISGYTRFFSVKIDSVSKLWEHIKRRALTLLLPWGVWSIIAFLLIESKKYSILGFISVASHKMEIAFWFLFSLWTIDMLFSVSQWIGCLIDRNRSERFRYYAGFALGSVGGGTALILIGYKLGITFLGIKYSLYYSVFYVLGFLLSKLKNSERWERLSSARDVVLLISVVLYAVLISRFNIMKMPDFSISILIRAFISALACYIAFEFIYRIEFPKSQVSAYIEKLGSLSLEMYVVHYFVVRLCGTESFDIGRIDGFGLAILYSVIVLAITQLIISILNCNKVARLVLFGKRINKEKL